MGSNARQVPHVIGPGGNILTMADLPPKNTRRWVPSRKAEVIAAVDGGLMSLSDACARYEISHEEFCAWVQAYMRHGLPGLRAGQLMDRWALTQTDSTGQGNRPRGSLQ